MMPALRAVRIAAASRRSFGQEGHESTATSKIGHSHHGHRMDEENAAVLIQSHWRRLNTTIIQMTKQMAATHVQKTWRRRIQTHDAQISTYTAFKRCIHATCTPISLQSGMQHVNAMTSPWTSNGVGRTYEEGIMICGAVAGMRCTRRKLSSTART